MVWDHINVAEIHVNVEFVERTLNFVKVIEMKFSKFRVSILS